MKALFKTLIAFLALHLLYSNTELLIQAAELIKGIPISTFSKVSKGIFALSYSVITITILLLYPRLWLITTVAVLDGFGIYLQYNVNQNNFILLQSLYFGIYTTVIVISSGLIRKTEQKMERKNEAERKNETKNEPVNETAEEILQPEKVEMDKNEIEKRMRRRSIVNSLNRAKNPELRAKLMAELAQLN